ncbi:hypothetical protein MRX96_028280 [Rhipicephalus microplus]
MPHDAMVEGEQISKEEAKSNGWIAAHRKRNADKSRFKHETHSARQTGAHVGPAKTSQLRKVAAASRLPRLPTSHFRVVVRPGGGLDVRTCRSAEAQVGLAPSSQQMNDNGRLLELLVDNCWVRPCC